MSDRGGTRTRLLTAAISVIDREGESAVRVRDVAAAAGVSYASLYHFFGDREGLIIAAQAERYRRNLFEPMEDVRAAIARCRTKREFKATIRRLLEGLFDPSRAPHRLTRLNVRGSALTHPALIALLGQAQSDFNAAVAEIFAEPQRKGWVRADVDLEMFATWEIGVMDARAILEMDPGRYDMEAWNRIASDALIAVLTGDPP